ncbi:hypothetical protein pipiens_011985 [Culex pipiens pipiens]|uniref:Uncharacterized protein n=1 Tax=Culex pipiens pipiens TaxID=38569 RepID=A0ABD1D471_CULPP
MRYVKLNRTPTHRKTMEKLLHRIQKKYEIKLLDRAIALCTDLKADVQSTLDDVVRLREKYCDRPEDDFNRLCVEIIAGQTSLVMDRTPERCSLESRISIDRRSFSPDSGVGSAYDTEGVDEPFVREVEVCSTPKRARRAESSRLSLGTPGDGHRTPKQIKEDGNYFTTTAMKVEREISACIKSLEFKFKKYNIRKKH